MPSAEFGLVRPRDSLGTLALTGGTITLAAALAVSLSAESGDLVPLRMGVLAAVLLAWGGWRRLGQSARRWALLLALTAFALLVVPNLLASPTGTRGTRIETADAGREGRGVPVDALPDSATQGPDVTGRAGGTGGRTGSVGLAGSGYADPDSPTVTDPPAAPSIMVALREPSTTDAPTTSQAPPASAERPAVPLGGELPYGLSSSPSAYGPRSGLPARRDAGAVVITTPGAVIENINATSISIQADNVTVRNARVVNNGSTTGTLVSWSGSRNVTLEDISVDGRINGAPGAYQAFGGWGTNVTVRRVEATGVSNGVEFGGSGLVEWSYIHDIWQRPGTQDHADGIQTDGGGPYTIRNNLVLMGTAPAGLWSQTSAIGMWADLANLRDTTVTNNVLGPHGGFIFYNGVVASPYTATNVSFTNNVMLRRPQGNEYGIWYSTSQYPMRGTHTGNLYADGTSAD